MFWHFASARLKNNLNFAMVVVEQNGLSLNSVPNEPHNGRKNMWKLFKNKSWALKNVPEDLLLDMWIEKMLQK